MKRLLSVFIVVLIFGEIFAAADSWIPPTSFEIQSEDGSKIFRFEPDPENAFDSHCKAALYDNTDQLIYIVENLRSWAYENNFFFSEDFRNFAFIPPADFDVGLEFYSNGVLKKTYHIKDLVKDHDKISYSTTKAWWLKGDANISEDCNTLTITTVDGLIYHFDIASGAVLNIKTDSSDIVSGSILNMGTHFVMPWVKLFYLPLQDS